MNDTGQYNREIKEAVQRLAGTFLKDNIQIIQAMVNTVDATTYTCSCTPISGDSTTVLPAVNLSANNNDGFIPIPAAGSTVLVAVSTKNNPPYLIGWDLLQGVICIVQNSDNTISQLIVGNGYTSTTNSNDVGQSSLQLNDGSLGGLVEVVNLTTKLNNLENLLNNLIGNWNSFCTNYVPGSPTVTGLPASLASDTESTLTLTVRGDIENTKVTHGV